MAHNRLSTKMAVDDLASGHSGDPKAAFKNSMKYDITRKERITNKSAKRPDNKKKRLPSCIQMDSGMETSMIALSSLWRLQLQGFGVIRPTTVRESFDSTCIYRQKNNESKQ